MKTTISVILVLFFNCASAQKPTSVSAPEKDFETFWTGFNNNYAFFELKGVDWRKTYETYRKQVNKNTSEKQLLDIFGKMIEPLNDGHVTISKGDEILYKSKTKSIFKSEFNGLEKEFRQTIDTTLIKTGFEKPMGIGPLFKNEHLFYYTGTSQTAYINITRCFGTSESLFDESKEAMDIDRMCRVFDSLLSVSRSCSKLIIDLRTNGGGHGGKELASRLVKEKTITHYKATVANGKKSEAIPQYIEPHKIIHSFKTVILLISDKTASSAEDFVIALTSQPNTITIGTHTSGMLSDMFGIDLSNGVSFTLSNEIYYSLDEKVLEGKGIEAQVQVTNSRQDIENKSDPCLVKALEMIK